MAEQWKLICKVKDIPLLGRRVVQRGLAWQELPGVALYRTDEEQFFALLDSCPQAGGTLSLGIVKDQWVCCAQQGWGVELASGRAMAPGHGSVRTYRVKVDDGKVYLDLAELNAPASRAEAALAGAFSVAPHVAAM